MEGMADFDRVCEITPCLYLTSASGASEINVRNMGIGLVINAARELPILDYGKLVRVVKIDVRDHFQENLRRHFPVGVVVMKKKGCSKAILLDVCRRPVVLSTRRMRRT